MAKYQILIICFMTIATLYGQGTVPRQMRQLYKQYKRGQLSLDNTNTIRYITAIPESVSSTSSLLFSLDAIHKQETIVNAELHFYRRTVEASQPLQYGLSVVNPHYSKMEQRERLAPMQRGWQVVNATITVKECVNTIASHYQLGVTFSTVDENQVAKPVDMKQFLRHHSLPFLLVFSNDSQSLDMDQIKRPFSLNENIIDPESGLTFSEKANRRSKRDINDNKIPMEVEHKPKPFDDHEYNKLSFVFDESNKIYNELSHMIKMDNDNKVNPETTTKSVAIDATPALDFQTKSQRRKDRKRKDRKRKKNKNLIPWPKYNSVKESDTNDKQFPDDWFTTEKFTDPQDTQCGRKRLTLNFEDLGWERKIIEPMSFDTFYCSGQCSFPYMLDMKPSNHATLQSLLHAIRIQTEVPAPCCVADKMSSLAIMFYDEFGNIVLKNYPDMVVESCACR